MTTFFICNAHIDPVWLWDKPEGIGAAISTFRSAADILDKYEGTVFCHNESLLYEYTEEYDPELFARIKKLVAERRWVIMGGWDIQPDCNMPCGEAFIRHIRQGQRYFAEKFGITGFETAVNLDPFGHSVGLCQILYKHGYRNYLVCRPSEVSPDRTFIQGKTVEWHGAAGSVITVFKSPSYSNTLGRLEGSVNYHLGKQQTKQTRAVLWGVGNHGGGPSRADTERLLEMKREHPEMGIVMSDPDSYFAEYGKTDKPDMVFENRSLINFAVGCYSSMCRVKKLNRELENKLLVAEKITAAARLNGIELPGAEEKINSAWKALLFCQFHDALPGSSVQSVEEATLNTLGGGISTAEDQINRAFFALSRGSSATKEGEYPLVIFNPHPFELETTAATEFVLAEQNRNEGEETYAEVYDEDGNLLISQNETESSSIPIDWVKKTSFRCKLAPLSCTRFNIRGRVGREKTIVQPQGDFYTFENGFYSAKLNLKSGFIDSYLAGGTEYLRPGAFRPLVMKDDSDPWGMNVAGFRRKAGEFKTVSRERASELCKAKDISPVHIVEEGDVRIIAEAVLSFKRSLCIIRYTFDRFTPDLGVSVRLYMNETERCVKLSVPTSLKDSRVFADTAYFRQELFADGNELPQGRYAALLGEEGCCAVLNAQSYGFDVKDGEMRITLLRTPGYAAHPITKADPLPSNRFSEHMDIGERVFEFVFTAGRDCFESLGSRATVFSQKPVVLSFTPPTGGERPVPTVKASDREVEVVTALEKDGGYELRVFNSTGQNKKSRIEFPTLGKAVGVELSGFEYKDIFVSR